MHGRLLIKLMMLSTACIVSLSCKAAAISAKTPANAIIHQPEQIPSKSRENIQLNQYIKWQTDTINPKDSPHSGSLMHLVANGTGKRTSQIDVGDPDGSAEDSIVNAHDQQQNQVSAQWYDEFRMPEAERQMLLKEYAKELAERKTELSWPNNKCRSKKDRARIATGLLDVEDKIDRPLEIAQREERLTPDLLKKIQSEIYRAYRISYLEPGASSGCLLVEKKEREIYLKDQQEFHDILMEGIIIERETSKEKHSEIYTNSTEDMPASDIKANTAIESDIEVQEADEWVPSEQDKESSEWILSESYKLYQYIKAIYEQTSGRFIVPYVTTDQMRQAKEDIQYIEKMAKRVNKEINTEKLWTDATDFNRDNIVLIKTHADIQYSEEMAEGTKKFIITLRNYAQTLRQSDGQQQTIKKDF